MFGLKKKKRTIPHRNRQKSEIVNAGGSCRKLMRSVARHNMERQEIPNPNRKLGSARKSFFARYWRDYVNP